MLPNSDFCGKFAKPLHCPVTVKFCDRFHLPCSLHFVVPKLKGAQAKLPRFLGFREDDGKDEFGAGVQ